MNNNKHIAMTTYTIYRAIFADSVEDIDFDNLGQSFAQDESLAESFAEDFLGSRGDYFMIEAEVTADQINIEQTSAQWLSKDWAGEGEVVLNENVEINIKVDGEEMTANTGFCRYEDDETRPRPIECDESEITDYL